MSRKHSDDEAERLERLAAENDAALAKIDREMDDLSHADETPRERQAREYQQIVPCIDCGHPTSPLGSHDCDRWREAIEPKQITTPDPHASFSGTAYMGSAGGVVGSAHVNASTGIAGAAGAVALELQKAQRDIARLEAEKAELARELGRRLDPPEPQGTPGPVCAHIWEVGDDHCARCGALHPRAVEALMDKQSILSRLGSIKRAPRDR